MPSVARAATAGEWSPAPRHSTSSSVRQPRPRPRGLSAAAASACDTHVARTTGSSHWRSTAVKGRSASPCALKCASSARPSSRCASPASASTAYSATPCPVWHAAATRCALTTAHSLPQMRRMRPALACAASTSCCRKKVRGRPCSSSSRLTAHMARNSTTTASPSSSVLRPTTPRTTRCPSSPRAHTTSDAPGPARSGTPACDAWLLPLDTPPAMSMRWWPGAGMLPPLPSATGEPPRLMPSAWNILLNGLTPEPPLLMLMPELGLPACASADGSVSSSVSASSTDMARRMVVHALPSAAASGSEGRAMSACRAASCLASWGEP
mmetsp:Transcript_14168/g.34956  ORF Transcript_14168/g.34956 Transcript_14168/m.34956 type:complete len:325 (-) Transcript_14168:766-1740(-)